MRVHKSQLPMVVSTYVEQHVMPKATGWSKVACGAFAFFAVAKPDAMFNHVVVKSMLDLVEDEAGTVDVNFLRDMAINSVKQTDGKFPPIMGYSLDSSDIDIIYNIAGQFASVGV